MSCAAFWTLAAQDLKSPRFFYLKLNNTPTPNKLITPNAESYTLTDPQISLSISTSLRYPISLFGKTKIIGEIGYQQLGLTGFFDPTESDDDDLQLRSLSFSFLGWHETNGPWSYFARLLLRNGSTDLFSINERSSIINLTQLIQKEMSGGAKIGFGTYLSYRDQFTLLPVFYWERKLGADWEVDMLLPSKVLFYRNMKERSRLLFGIRGESANYYLEEEKYQNIFDANFRRISAKFVAGVEHQLNRWFGLSAEAGMVAPFFSGIYQRDRRWKLLHSFEDKITPYFQVSIFCSVDK